MHGPVPQLLASAQNLCGGSVFAPYPPDIGLPCLPPPPIANGDEAHRARAVGGAAVDPSGNQSPYRRIPQDAGLWSFCETEVLCCAYPWC